MTDTDDVCGYETTDGHPCQNPPGENGRCWITSHNPGDGDDNPQGRPSKFSDDRASDAIEAATEGKSKAGCARAAGVDKATLERWLDSNPELPDGGSFRNAFMRARAEGESKILEGGLYDEDVNPSMAKFLLASSFGYQKSEKRELETTGDGIEVVADFTDE